MFTMFKLQVCDMIIAKKLLTNEIRKVYCVKPSTHETHLSPQHSCSVLLIRAKFPQICGNFRSTWDFWVENLWNFCVNCVKYTSTIYCHESLDVARVFCTNHNSHISGGYDSYNIIKVTQVYLRYESNRGAP